MKIVGHVCEQHKWGYVTVGLAFLVRYTRTLAKCGQYNGEMSQDARNESLKKFKNHSNVKVLIASLKCGGVGLNLTMASKVICVDLWWNSAIEQQGKTLCTSIHGDSCSSLASILPRLPHWSKRRDLYLALRRQRHN